MTRKHFGRREIMAVVSGLLLCSGCVYKSPAHYPEQCPPWSLITDQAKIIDERYDRARLEALAGKPTIDDGEEWVYVVKFNDMHGIPVDTLFAVWGSGDQPNWKIIVVTFDTAGIVSHIRVASAPSEIWEDRTNGWLMGIPIERKVRLRAPPTTRPTTQPAGAPVPHVAEAPTLDKLFAEVNSADWKVRTSLPELKFAMRKGFVPWATSISTLSIRSVDGDIYQIVIVRWFSGGIPGTEFMLAYLRSPKGELVDWKSQWLDIHFGSFSDLRTQILDLNQSGIPDFCFSKGSLPLLAAWCVRDNKFVPTIAEHKSYIDVKFEETALDDGIIIQPQEKSASWETDKLYEIPIKIINRSSKPVDLRGRNVTLSPFDFNGMCGCEPAVEIIPAGGTVETTMTIMFSGGWRRSFRFALEREP